MTAIRVALLAVLISIKPASAIASFCKCTCFSNSTIIRLTDESGNSGVCLECTRKFCLDYNLPICKDAKEDVDVSTICFQRDSVKDETIVILFICLTGGLIIYALAKTQIGKFRQSRRYSQL
ncbi:hypothetical protein V1511DRAFT_492156 [Dipodascopsis uninucleata]